MDRVKKFYPKQKESKKDFLCFPSEIHYFNVF
jgi:hypothetical protein